MAKRNLFDRNILIIIGFLILAGLGILIFKQVQGKHCPEVKFVWSDNPTENTEIHFSNQTEAGPATFDWNFGDGSPHQFAKDAVHEYTVTGSYSVTLMVVVGRDSCYRTQTIFVAGQYIPIDTSSPGGNIFGPDSIEVGKPYPFEDKAPKDTSWQWDFAETGIVDAYERKGTYLFHITGWHTIKLIVNGKGTGVTKRVYVKYVEKHAGGGNSPKRLPDKDKFQEQLNSLRNQQNKYMILFKDCICDFSQQVMVNERPCIFSSYCRGLQFDPGITVTDVKFDVDKKNHCIINIRITDKEQNQ